MSSGFESERHGRLEGTKIKAHKTSHTYYFQSNFLLNGSFRNKEARKLRAGPVVRV